MRARVFPSLNYAPCGRPSFSTAAGCECCATQSVLHIHNEHHTDPRVTLRDAPTVLSVNRLSTLPNKSCWNKMKSTNSQFRSFFYGLIGLFNLCLCPLHVYLNTLELFADSCKHDILVSWQLKLQWKRLIKKRCWEEKRIRSDRVHEGSHQRHYNFTIKNFVSFKAINMLVYF